MSNATIDKYIGKGLVFPINVNSTGGVSLTTGFEVIHSSIRIILSWLYGTRFFLGEFGSKLEELIEEPNDLILAAQVRFFIIEAITRWEKRITPLEVSINRKDEHSINIILRYQLINSKIENTFVFPYYSQLIY